MSDYEKHHKDVQQRLRDSEPAVRAVAQWLSNLGMPVEIPELKIAPSRSVAESYKDDGDLFYVVRKRAEVKGRGIQFTSKKDFPYPTLLVCAEASFTRAVEDKAVPELYISVAKDLIHLAVISVPVTREFWTVGWQTDRARGPDYKYRAFYIKKEHVVFCSMEEI